MFDWKLITIVVWVLFKWPNELAALRRNVRDDDTRKQGTLFEKIIAKTKMNSHSSYAVKRIENVKFIYHPRYVISRKMHIR